MVMCIYMIEMITALFINYNSIKLFLKKEKLQCDLGGERGWGLGNGTQGQVSYTVGWKIKETKGPEPEGLPFLFSSFHNHCLRTWKVLACARPWGGRGPCGPEHHPGVSGRVWEAKKLEKLGVGGHRWAQVVCPFREHAKKFQPRSGNEDAWVISA